MNQHSGPATLPRGFRCPDYDDVPRTPEPFSQLDDAQIPSPPRPRLKLRRRVVSQLTAPTQQFLASVAAADVPIPSIEEPEIAADDYDMNGRCPFPEFRCEDDGDIRFLRPGHRGLSAPKTPVPDLEASLPQSRYPNWTLGSVSSVESTPEPDYESSRPSTSRSTQTSSSLFSRFSHASDDDQCDNFGDENYDKDDFMVTLDAPAPIHRPAADLRRKARKAPWTKAMSDHLWSTFLLYLQDPKVTPFRMGKTCIPPHGVCLRVSREAKRSWKGSKPLSKTAPSSEGANSGSATPTAESTGTFIQWPHTCAATRAHLRDLCKLKASSRGNNSRFTSRSITPFTQAAARHWNRRSTPARPAVPFATQDMSLSLAMSTSESMQPNGPLAQLTASDPEPAEPARSPVLAGQTLGTFEGEPSFAERTRLGSPFGASSSYGPSSSGSLAAALGLTGSLPRRQSQTVGPRRALQSPVRLSRSGTQKRRHTQSGVPRKRPSIGSDLWLEPGFRAVAVAAAAAGGATSALETSAPNHKEEFLVPRIPPIPTLTSSTSMPNVMQLDDSAMGPPPRLGSPFTGESSSFSYPHRVHRMHQGGSIDLGMLGRPFATIQQFSADASPPPMRNRLADRLAYIDQRLKELRQRDATHRAESPL